MEELKKSFQPNAPPLTTQQTEQAMETLQYTFPKIIRSHIDPVIPGQDYGNISFMLLNDPHILKNGNTVYGYLKLRGTFRSEQNASEDAERIIQTVDSKNIIHTAPVGHWVPITNDERYSKDLLEVKDKETDVALRDNASKEKQKSDEIKVREIKENLHQLQSDDRDDANSLSYYTTKRVANINIRSLIHESKERISKFEEGIQKNILEMERIEKEHPSYKETWIELYNKERQKAGFPKFDKENEFNPEWNKLDR